MALINRVSRLLRADLHAVLDRIEEPEMLLRQAVREMEEELAQDERRLKLMTHEHAQTGTRMTELQGSLAELAGELDICFAARKEDLARSLIRRRLEAERLQGQLQRRAQRSESEIAGLRTRIEQNRARLEAMRQKAELLAEEDRPLRPEGPWGGPDLTVREEDVEVAFLAEKHRRAER